MKGSIQVKNWDGFSYLDQEWTDLIIKICFDVSELGHLFQMENGQDLIALIRCDKEIKDDMDTLISSFNIHDLKKNIGISRKNMEYRIQLYQAILYDFEHKLEIITVLKNLNSYLNRMKVKINEY